MSRRTAVCLGFASALAVTACDAEPREVTMRIDHYREPCDGAEPGFCLRVLESSDPQIAAAERIGGFEHRWGSVYDVVVLVSDDGDVEEYDLVEIVSETRVTEQARFEIELSPAFIERVESHEFKLVSDATAYCIEPEVCAAVGRSLADGQPFVVELSHNPADSGTFIAHAFTQM